MDASGECLQIQADGGFSKFGAREPVRQFPARFLKRSILPSCDAAKKQCEGRETGERAHNDKRLGLWLVQLNQQQEMDGPTNLQGNNTVDDKESEDDNGEVSSDSNDAILADTDTGEDQSNNKLTDADANENQSGKKVRQKLRPKSSSK